MAIKHFFISTEYTQKRERIQLEFRIEKNYTERMQTTQETIFSVSELTLHIKRNLESLFASVRVEGEITNLKHQSSGHIYFSIKDAQCQISAVLFRGSASKMSRLPKDGDKVVAQAQLSVYAPRGTYQLVVFSLDYGGVGDLLLQLHQLKEQLQGLGYFTQERKKPLPPFPKTIGVVTSPTGAVIQDILNVLSRRTAGFHLILNPVKVQGEGSAKEVAQAINQFNLLKNVDVIIVARGGGSLEDLWAFNERCVADAIFHSKIPIIAAIGHETDVSIADFVADVRAPTPSAAAEIVLKEKSTLIERLGHIRQTIRSTIVNKAAQFRLKLDRFAHHPIFKDPFALIAPFSQRLDDMTESISDLMHLKVERLRTAFENKKSLLAAHDPKNVLKKGYCIPFSEKEGHVILGSKQLNPKETISLMFSDGDISATVEEIFPHE